MRDREHQKFDRRVGVFIVLFIIGVLISLLLSGCQKEEPEIPQCHTFLMEGSNTFYLDSLREVELESYNLCAYEETVCNLLNRDIEILIFKETIDKFGLSTGYLIVNDIIYDSIYYHQIRTYKLIR